ncbi:MAG: phosphoribosylglycinamide formyltransferase [Dehalococcoidia bacterium]
MLRIGWFSTGRDEAACQLLEAAWQAIQADELKACIVFVFSNRERGENPASDRFFDLVEGYGIPLICLSSRRFREARGEPPARAGEPLPAWRTDYDRAVIGLLETHPFDLGVLAGYMLIFTEEACQRYHLLNLHPAPPGGPAGTWQEVIWQLMEQRASVAGVMMHLATKDLDQGPPVTYCTYPIRGAAFDTLWAEVERKGVAEVRANEGEGNRLFQEIRRQGVLRELPLVVATLRAFADGKVRIENGRVVDASGQPIDAYDLTQEIDRLVSRA